METGKVEYAPDHKPSRVNVRISQETGGAYADPQEVVRDELAKIQQERSAKSIRAEYARLKDAVVEAAKARRKAKLAEPNSAGNYIELLHSTMTAEHSAVDALLAFEREHKIGPLNE